LARSYDSAAPAEARVLLVDDATETVRLIRAILERSRTPRFEVLSTGDPEAAIRRVREETFDAILLDYMLPGRTGLDVLKEINRERRQPVIVLTGQGDEKTAIEFFHAGAYDYIPKAEGRSFSESLLRALRDLLRRRTMEQELAREKVRAKTILESQPTMVCCLDADLRIRETNRSFRRFLQQWRHPERGDGEPDDPIGTALPELIDDEAQRERLTRNLKGVLEGNRPFQEEVEITTGGVPRVLWLLASPLQVADGVAEGIVLTYTDLTEQRRLTSLQLRLARAVDSSLDGVMITDTRGRIEYFNPAFARMTGYRPEDLRARRTRLPQISADSKDLGRSIREKLTRGEEWQGEVVNRRKDGSLYFADMTISPIRDDAGTLIGFVSTERDVTEKKVFTDELIKAREAAEESLRAKDMFLATVSHELRTPLTSIIGFADLLLLDSTVPGPAQGFAESIMRAGRHLKRLIDDILDLSRFTGGRFYLDLEPLNLRSVLEEALEMIRAESEAQQIPCELEVDPRLPALVVIDRMKLQQVLLNLLSNAVKYSGGGRVRLMAGPLFTEQQAEANDKPRMMVFSVEDQGPGIPVEHQGRIFEEFVQLGAGALRRRTGSGLGLSISQRLVRLMGGAIWVDSKPNEGTRFSFTLPLATPDGSNPSVRSGETEGRGPCLVVHRIHPGAVPGESELAGWGYHLHFTDSLEELQHGMGADEPFACIVSAGTEIAPALQQIAEVSWTSAERVGWFLVGRTGDDEATALGRVVALGDIAGPGAEARLIHAFGSLPAGSRRILVDPRDAETSTWVRSAAGKFGIPVGECSMEGAAPDISAEDGVVLVLDLSRDAARAFNLWRSVADRTPRLLVGLRYSRGSSAAWAQAVDSAWESAAGTFAARAAQRLRWMLNAMHTCASHGRGRMAAANLAGSAPSTDQTGPLPTTAEPILVVEDNVENRDLICRLLASFELRTRAAQDGATALAIASQEPLSMVLMDIEMPDMDGCEVTRALHRASGSDHLPIVAMTAHVGPEDRRRCHEAGCIDFLPKPIERGDLQRVLRRWLGRSGPHPLEEHIPTAPGEDVPLPH
jgi:PAS domain S-box-containing protein